MALFLDGSFTSHSGLLLPFKIDCRALTPADWDCVARMVKRCFPFKAVYGIPTGGVALANALAPFATPGGMVTLIVDDVLTTGQSMEEARERLAKDGMWAVRGVVLFSRAAVVPDWITPVFRLSSEFVGAGG